MTTIPKNLVEAILTVMNDTVHYGGKRGCRDLPLVRDILIAAGCIEPADGDEYAVVADGCGHSVCTGCVDCGRHGVHDDKGLCNDCRGPDWSDNDYEVCVCCGDFTNCDEEQLCASCGG